MKNMLLFLFAALAWSATALCQTPADSAARPRKRVFTGAFLGDVWSVGGGDSLTEGAEQGVVVLPVVLGLPQ